MVAKKPKKFWYFAIGSFLLWFLLLLSFYHSDMTAGSNGQVSSLKSNFVGTHESKIKDGPIDNFFVGGDWNRYLDDVSKKVEEQIRVEENEAQKQVDSVAEQEKKTEKADSDSCTNQYIYVHDLPREYNEDLLQHCEFLSEWSDMCSSISNVGLGPKLRNPERVFSNTGWYDTNQFTLEVIFHNRMKSYKCLTNDSSLASAIFVPYYAGLDVARYLWNSHASMRDYHSLSLLKWLREKPEWKRMWGRDHFLVAGRITWDFRRLTDGNSDWGNKLMILPESRNMTMLTIESSPWHLNDFAIPYPTYFHPASDNEVFQWQNRTRRIKRRFLFSFVGASRPNITNSIRGEIIKQCQATRRKCKMLECASGSDKCYKPVNVMRIFQSSVFCLQPSGDSYTRRSTFDSILAGCIPVFFHPGSAYVQYLWHLPKDYTKYSVFIPGNKLRHGKASIERTLSRIPKAKVLALREQVIKLIPGVVYADPRSNLEMFEDAFDVTVEGVIERVDKIRKDMREGKEVSAEEEEFSWKKILYGTIAEHEWDHFFARP